MRTGHTTAFTVSFIFHSVPSILFLTELEKLVSQSATVVVQRAVLRITSTLHVVRVLYSQGFTLQTKPHSKIVSWA